MQRTCYHVQTDAGHARDRTPFREGQILTVGTTHNPFYGAIRISATHERHDVSRQDVRLHLSKMLRESVFESVRLTHQPALPSRTTCLWLAESLEDARYWLGRIDHPGRKRLFEMKLLEGGSLHRAYEGHLTDAPECIHEIEARARRYWRGEPARDGRPELLYAGRLQVLRELA